MSGEFFTSSRNRSSSSAAYCLGGGVGSRSIPPPHVMYGHWGRGRACRQTGRDGFGCGVFERRVIGGIRPRVRHLGPRGHTPTQRLPGPAPCAPGGKREQTSTRVTITATGAGDRHPPGHHLTSSHPRAMGEDGDQAILSRCQRTPPAKNEPLKIASRATDRGLRTTRCGGDVSDLRMPGSGQPNRHPDDLGRPAPGRRWRSTTLDPVQPTFASLRTCARRPRSYVRSAPVTSRESSSGTPPSTPAVPAPPPASRRSCPPSGGAPGSGGSGP